MAVRYRVENLIRRGNIFYWRPRIPSRFEACPSGSRLALSLQVSDHGRAEIIARRLNTLLAKLKFGPMSRTVTRENLQRLCAAERDEELDRQDDHVFVSRRHGRVNQIQDVEMDLENAWAYRLIEMFGAQVSLTLAEGCPGRSYLRANGVPEAHQANIFHNYSQLRAEFLSRYGANVLARKMAAFDIEDTAINREKTLQHVARGRADALMAVDERYPFADKSLSALTGGTAPGFASAPAAEEASTPLSRSPAPAECEQGKEAPAAAVPTADVPIPPGRPDAAPEAIVLGTLLPAGPTGETSQSASPILVVREAANKGRPLPIAEFMDIFEKLVANKKQDWTEESARDARALVSILVGVLHEHGVEHSGQITQYHVGQLRQHFHDIPTRWGQSARMRAMSPAELRAEGRRLVTEWEDAMTDPRKAEALKDKKPAIGLHGNTVRKHFANLGTFFQHLKANGYQIFDWSFDGLRPRKLKPGEIRLQQFKPKPNDVRPIFSTPIHTGCASSEDRGAPGSLVYHDALYYLPLLYTYLGARRKEFAGLAVGDVYQAEHGWVIDLRPNAFRNLKNPQSHRQLPLPDELIRLNFLEYRQQIAELGYQALFPDLFSHLTRNDPGDRFYDAFVPLMQTALGDELWKRTLHALRHGLSDTLKQRGVPPEIIDDITGRLSEGETNTRYTNIAEVPLMRDALARYPIITDDIQPRPIRLLPWVRARQPAPWARASPGDGGNRK
ncbi:MAG: integrase [Pseudochelatococcus sp.]|uniref:DUF6538 domain-containing protein n=1 Tax=Pseudochelatococcus sp. TaxID=2020869 RepID=UPI003D8A1BF1